MKGTRTRCLLVAVSILESIPLLGQSSPVFTNTYYFPHLALGGGWQTVLTYVNYSQQAVTCQTAFLDDNGFPLSISFGGVGTSSTRTDMLPPGGEIHEQSQADTTSPQITGWAYGQCTGPVKASLLFRIFSGNTASGEAGVNASTTPSTKFVTYAQSLTGVAYANPSTTDTAVVTVTALNSTGVPQGSTSISLAPNHHGAANIGPLLGLNFSGSVQITSTFPILSISINAEAFPVFSSLPPGDLDGSTALAASRSFTSGAGSNYGSPYTNLYYLPHLALGGGWQTVLTYVNYSPQTVTCKTDFVNDNGMPLGVSFGGLTSSNRTDVLAPGGEIHQQSQVDPRSPEVTGWAQGQCTGPVKASLLFRLFSGGTPTAEASVDASTTPTAKFVTYAQTLTGLACANPTSGTASVTVIALDSSGSQQASGMVNLAPGAHAQKSLGSFLSLANLAGSAQIISTVPIVCLSINAEEFPTVSSLPPGDLDGSTPLSTGH